MIIMTLIIVVYGCPWPQRHPPPSAGRLRVADGAPDLLEAALRGGRGPQALGQGLTSR